jgi:hypothetical protein
MDGLPCLNCQKPVQATEARIFAGTFVCPACFAIATRMEARLTSELKRLLLMTREAIRISIVERRLVLGPADEARDLSKKEVLEAIIQLQDRADAAPRAVPTIKEKRQ